MYMALIGPAISIYSQKALGGVRRSKNNYLDLNGCRERFLFFYARVFLSECFGICIFIFSSVGA